MNAMAPDSTAQPIPGPSGVRGLLHGASYLWRGYALLRRPALWPYVVMPLVINVLLFALAFGALIWAWDWAATTWLAESWQWLKWLLLPLLLGAFLLIVMTAFLMLAQLIASPFNGQLSDRVELLLTGQVRAGGQLSFWAIVRLALRDELHKRVYFLSRALLLMLLLLVPGLNLLSPFVWLMFSAWALSLDFAGTPLGNAGFDFPAQRVWAKQQRAVAIGFGLVITGAALVPILNLTVMPAAVAGATCWWVDRNRASSPVAPPSP